MKFEEFFKEIEDDLYLDSVNIQKKLFEIPQLHSKYLKRFYMYKKEYYKYKKELEQLYTKKYNLLKNGDELLDKKEIQFMIVSDEEYSDLNYKIKQMENMIDILERTIKKVNNLSFDIKNIIDWVKFQAGE